jgi:hypothetical protein
MAREAWARRWVVKEGARYAAPQYAARRKHAGNWGVVDCLEVAGLLTISV